MHKTIRMKGAGCVRADRYGTFEVGGQEVLPRLVQALREECPDGEGELCLAGRLTVKLEVWEQPLSVRCGARRREDRA